MWIQAIFEDPLGLHFSPFWLHLGLPRGTLSEAFGPLVPVLDPPRAENRRILRALVSRSFFKRFLVPFWGGLGPLKHS